MDSQPSAPPVVAVVVTCDPGPWFEEALSSLADQDYPNLSVLVIDSASVDDPTHRVAEVLATAYVRRLEERVGFGRAANEVLGVVEGASHFLLCHDDVALAPDAVRHMVEEAYRSNAGVITPKLVEWDQPERLLAVGATADKVGVLQSLVDLGELDQQQHDAVRDVFVAPGGAVLVRADLFRTLGGFDPVIDCFGEELDLCWRAQIAGARVVVAPDARVRHREALTRGERPGWATVTARRRVAARTDEHRFRTLVTCYGWLHLLWVFPIAVVYLLGEAAALVARGRPGEALAMLRSCALAFRRPGRLWRARRQVQSHRQVRDGELRRAQAGGSARLRAFVRSRLDDPASSGALPVPVAPSAAGAASWRVRAAVAVVLVVVVAFGSRDLLTHAVPAVGQLPQTSSGWAGLWRSWWSTWQRSGLGVSAPSSPALALLGVLATVAFGAVGAVQHAVVLGPLVLGPLGAYRAARWWGSSRGRVVAMVVYATVPLPYNALAGGRWSGLLAYAAAPWVLGALGRLSGEMPFPTTRGTQVVGRVVGLGLLVAVVAAAVPSWLLVLPVVGIALLGGSLLAGRPSRAARPLVVAVVAAAVAGVLLLPWSADVLTSRVSTFGVAVGPGGRLGLGQVLRFATGPVGSGPLGWALLVAAALPLLIGRGWRLAWAARLWLVALAGFAWAWAGMRGWVPVAAPEVVLAPAAAALAASAALGAVAFELDLPGYRFGWRQLASGLAAVAVLVAAVPMLSASGGGRWRLPSADASSVLGFLPGARHGDYRVLWVGAPAALPLAGRYLDQGVAYGTSLDGLPGPADLWTTAALGAAALAGHDLRLTESRRTTELGHLLAPMAVRYLVVPNHYGPAGSGARPVPTPGALLSGLELQTDLQLVNADPDYTVYQNAAWAPARAVLPASAAAVEGQSQAAGQRALQRTALTPARPVLTGGGPAGSAGVVPGGQSVYVSATRDASWRLQVGGHALRPRPAFGWAMSFAVPPGEGGAATLRPDASVAAHAWQLVEVLLWAVAVAVAALDLRRRRNRSPSPEQVKPEWFSPMTPGTGSGTWRRPARGLGAADMEGEEVWIDV